MDLNPFFNPALHQEEHNYQPLSKEQLDHIASELVAPSNFLNLDRSYSNLVPEVSQVPVHFSTGSLGDETYPSGMDKRHPSSFQQLEKVSSLPGQLDVLPALTGSLAW